jgi:integrase
MSRTSTLKPAFRQERADRNLLAWCVNIPPKLSETGKRQQLFFATQAEAKTQCNALKVRKSNFGDTLATMSAVRIAEAAEAYKLLDPLNINLLDAVRAHIDLVNTRSASVTMGEAFDRFAESRKGKSIKYRQEIRHTKGTVESLLDRMICDITPSDLEPLLDRLPNASRNAKMRRLRAVFNLATKRGWMLKENPISKLDFATTRREEVEVFPVDVIQKLLKHALESDLEFLPYRIFTFFCGIRPEGELERLNWSDVRIAERMVVLPAAITKTQRKRFVDLSDNAIAWLTEYQVRGGNMVGLVAPWTPQIRRTKHRNSYKAVGIKEWIQQGARHSYCSYWLALNKDVNKLVLQSGHTDADTMWTRYHAGVTEAEARKFWSIRPSFALANVLPMTA